MEFLTLKTYCCEKEMIKVNVYNHITDMETIRFFCGVCGEFMDINNYKLDDEELLNEIENNEEMQNTPIHKEILKDNK